MGYMEEIFQRVEEQFTSDSAKLAWLSSFERPERGSTAYTRSALKVREELISADLIRKEYKQTSDLSTLKKLKREVDSLTTYGEDVSADIRFKIESIETLQKEIKIKEEQEKEIEAQKEAEEIREEKKKAREQFKRSQLEEEERGMAEEVLGRRSVSQLKRYERERTRRGFQIFNEEN